ncbi:TDP-N-acetylfucosamine:lipid II N-acetylfucosaminyltransferase [Litorivicinus sp.]|nr:TDP-N-acetylfucosamine:lipid II N-acetylfucosaminyltransferase [Litorivicinus sp.]
MKMALARTVRINTKAIENMNYQILIISPKNQRKFSLGWIKLVKDWGQSHGVVIEVLETEKRSVATFINFIKLVRTNTVFLYFSLLHPSEYLYASCLFRKNKKIWITFGGDIYSRKYSKILENNLIRKMNIATAVSEKEKEIILKKYGIEMFRICFPIMDDKCEPIHGLINSSLNTANGDEKKRGFQKLMLGNNGYPSQRHEDILNRLHLESGDISISIPCAYGDKSYIDQLRESYSDKLNLTFEETFLSKADYVSYLSGIDIALFNNDRQQGYQTIIMLIALGKTIYISSENLVSVFLKEYGFHFFLIEEISLDLNGNLKSLDEKILKENINTAKALTSAEHFSADFAGLMDRLDLNER